MDAITNIINRRSIRKFSTKRISDEIIVKILQCAASAPSAWNQQAWHFIVVRNKEMIIAFSKFHPYAKTAVSTANVVIVVCQDVKTSREIDEKMTRFLPIDCALAAENILLSANALGIGAVYISLYPVKERQDGARILFNIHAGISPFCFIPMGYPAEIPGDKIMKDISVQFFE